MPVSSAFIKLATVKMQLESPVMESLSVFIATKSIPLFSPCAINMKIVPDCMVV